MNLSTPFLVAALLERCLHGIALRQLHRLHRKELTLRTAVLLIVASRGLYFEQVFYTFASMVRLEPNNTGYMASGLS
ncbi:RBR-type E3 ubiquitin transferase [Fusarium oxysporum f. sp. albedinis]|nr:RBR-type E3 ubiquitin transferase [Fusarium oxysporum f. sp. albedinis]